ncbi:MAG: glycoside hydrolase family 32 protein [Clostridiales bacterium]|nr:glycoside hydrolase family 32 protein [Clostridiales bacterium]
MDYSEKLSFHYQTAKGWVNDPNGLVYFRGYYHVFYQHLPDFEVPVGQYMHWGHARTKDFLSWEELPPALCPDMPYDAKGCWSGTAIVKDDTLYLFYASIYRPQDEQCDLQTVSVAYSSDGVHFEKYAHNPVIQHYPCDGGPDFRDPAVCFADGKYRCVMASGNPERKTALLLLYESSNLLDWEYTGIMREWEDAKYAECPSFTHMGNGYLLSASVCKDDRHFFFISTGSFKDGVFTPEIEGEVNKGPDQYAGQVFRDNEGRNILISWIPGWSYIGYADKDVGCMSAACEIKLAQGRLCAYPVHELQHLLKTEDPAVRLTQSGFEIERTGRDPVVYNGQLRDLKILRDKYILEVYVNGGQEIYTVLL